jgi:hypothetical protein
MSWKWVPSLTAGILSACSTHPGASEETAAFESQCKQLLADLTAKDGTRGFHGPFHNLKEDKERELWNLLARAPRYPGAPKMLLRAIDDVYLRYHENMYHGWIWHCPYFDCKKAVELSDRLLAQYPDFTEEALWTKLYCYRIKGLDGNRYPYDSDFKMYATVKAQTQWESDGDKVRALCRELQEKFPKGKYAKRIPELLEMKDIEVTLPDSWGTKPVLLDRLLE